MDKFPTPDDNDIITICSTCFVELYDDSEISDDMIDFFNVLDDDEVSQETIDSQCSHSEHKTLSE